MNHQDDINNSQNAQNGGFIFNVANKPLPWIMILALMVIYCAVQSHMALRAAFDSQTQCMLVADHVRDLRESMAAHGVTPLPTFPEKLK